MSGKGNIVSSFKSWKVLYRFVSVFTKQCYAGEVISEPISEGVSRHTEPPACTVWVVWGFTEKNKAKASHISIQKHSVCWWGTVLHGEEKKQKERAVTTLKFHEHLS